MQDRTKIKGAGPDGVVVHGTFQAGFIRVVMLNKEV
jgi:hypothetical protein